MTAPARTTPGPLHRLNGSAFLADGSVELRDFLPRKDAQKVTLGIRATAPGVLRVDRMFGTTPRRHLPDIAITAAPTDADEDHTVKIAYVPPGKVLRFTFTNNNATAGTIVMDASYDGQGSAGA